MIVIFDCQRGAGERLHDAALFYGDILPKEMIAVPLGPLQRYLVVRAGSHFVNEI